MNYRRRLLVGIVFLCPVSFHIFSCNHQRPPARGDWYKKKFIVDTENNNVTDFIKRRENGTILSSFFAPNADIQGLLVGLMKKEKKSMRITIYSLRDTKIFNTILEALDRGIDVEVIFDSRFEKDQLEKKLKTLDTKGAKVFVFKRPKNRPHEHITGIMHNKYVLFEDNIYGEKLLWSGSCNFSSSSHRLNQENIYVCNNRSLFNDFALDFELCKRDFCYPYGKPDSAYVNEINNNIEQLSNEQLEKAINLGRTKPPVLNQQVTVKRKKKVPKKRQRVTHVPIANEQRTEIGGHVLRKRKRAPRADERSKLKPITQKKKRRKLTRNNTQPVAMLHAIAHAEEPNTIAVGRYNLRRKIRGVAVQ